MARMLRRGAQLARLALFTCALTVGADAAAARPLFGVAEPHSFARGDLPPAFVAEKISELGASVHRFAIEWYRVEPSPPGLGGIHAYDFRRYDAMVAADAKRGILALPVLVDAPTWAWPAGVPRDQQVTGMPPDAEHYADYAALAAEVARRYPSAIGIEIWNEPNLSQFWGRGAEGVRPDPAAYTGLLKEAHAAIKAANPDIQVVGGSMSPLLSNRSAIEIPYPDFARGMLAAGAGPYLDGLSVHSNAHHRFNAQGYPYLATPVMRLREVLETAALGSLPIWLTEFGVSTTGEGALSEAAQAERLARLARWALVQPGLAAFIVHSLSEPLQYPAGDREVGFGLIRRDGAGRLVQKPAYRALQATVAQPSLARFRFGPLILAVKLLKRRRAGASVARVFCESPCRLQARLRQGQSSLRLAATHAELPGGIRGYSVALSERAAGALRRRSAGPAPTLALSASLDRRSETRQLRLRR